MKIKIDPADTAFSIFIRLRDRRCVRCGSPVRFNDEGKPISHQCSHYYGRGQESTRCEPDNCDTLCHGCHVYWGGQGREDYRNFKLKQLGQDRFDSLMVQAKTYCKKDRKLALIKARALIQSLER